jgi:hypothetical protein
MGRPADPLPGFPPVSLALHTSLGTAVLLRCFYMILWLKYRKPEPAYTLSYSCRLHSIVSIWYEQL